MTRYTGPDSLQEDEFECKFVRIGGTIVIGPDRNAQEFDFYSKSHADIVREDGLILELEKSYLESDAGFISITKIATGGIITIDSDSLRLALPRNQAARDKTREVLLEMHQGFEVKELGANPNHPEKR